MQLVRARGLKLYGTNGTVYLLGCNSYTHGD